MSFIVENKTCFKEIMSAFYTIQAKLNACSACTKRTYNKNINGAAIQFFFFIIFYYKYIVGTVFEKLTVIV